MAALSGGSISSWEALSEKIQMSECYLPKEENFEIYRKHGVLFDSIYHQTKEIMHQLAQNDDK